IQKLTKAGSQALHHNDANQALCIFKRAYLHSLNLSEQQVQNACLFNLGAAYIAVGKAKKGLKCLVRTKLKGSQERDADLYFNIATAYDTMNEYCNSVKFYEKAISQYKKHEVGSIADAQIKLGYCFTNTGEPSSAAHAFREAGLLYQNAQKVNDAAMALREATKYMLQSDTFSKSDVLQVLSECLQLCKEITDPTLQGKLYNDVGLHYAELKCFSQAEQCFIEAMNLCSGGNFSIKKRAVQLQNLGAVNNALNQYEKSLRYHTEAADMYGALKERKAQGGCLCNLAYAYSQLKNYNMALFYYEQALCAFIEEGDLHGQWQVCEGLGATQFCLGNIDQAISFYKQALAVFGRSKDISDTLRKRIEDKLTDAIEYKVRHQPPASHTVKTTSL
uniref:Uncharacterized protein n=1 Tax=Latimeria chalumnae TaxID=7897 RepID=H3APS9_LATCH